MNRLSLNSGPLGGVVRGLILATAVIVCMSSVNADSIRVAKATADIDAQALVTPDLTYTHTALINVAGLGELYPNSTHKHATVAELTGSASIQAYILRVIPASSIFTATADVVAVVASYLGTSNLLGTAAVLPTATRVQAASSIVDSTASIALVAGPTVYRMHTANVLGTSGVRAEYAFKDAALGYSNNPAYFAATGYAGVLADALCYRTAAINISGQAVTLARGTLEQPAFATPFANAVLLNAAPFIEATLIVVLNTSSNVTALATLNKVGLSNVFGTADTVAATKQLHKAQTTVAGAAELIVNNITYRGLSASVSGTCTLAASATKYLIATTSLTATGNMQLNAAADTTTPGVVTINGTAGITCVADSVERLAFSDLLATAAVSPSLAITRYVSAEINGTCVVLPNAGRTILLIPKVLSYPYIFGGSTLNGSPFGTALDSHGLPNFRGSAELFVDTVTNPYSYDPIERTFVRPVSEVEFIRPFIETEFRRQYEAGYDL